MRHRASASAVGEALAAAPPEDGLLGTYSCKVGSSTYTCVIKRDAKGKLVLTKPCCSWTWYFYLSNVTDAGFSAAGAAQVDRGWKAASGRGTFSQSGPTGSPGASTPSTAITASTARGTTTS